MTATAFEVDIAADVIADMKTRLARTRWPDQPEPGWGGGTDLTYMKELVRYWLNDYDWERERRALNALPHYKADVDGLGIHFIHARGKGPATLPLILTHGWPDSFLRFKAILPLLTDPEAHGGDAADAFDVVIPSLPGTGFSDRPKTSRLSFQTQDLWATLMTKVLGYERFGAHGGDWGSIVTERLARSHAGSVIGIHLTDVPFLHTFRRPDDLTPAEARYFADIEEFQMTEGAYNMIQGTRPQTLAGLADSPAALAAWLLEKFQSMNDCGGDLDRCFGRDLLLTNVTIYWATESTDASFLPYYDLMGAGAATWISEQVKQWLGSSTVPAGFALFPRDNSHPPREWAERFFNVQRWTPMPRGAHFGAMEEPQLLAEELRAFFRPLR